MQYIVKKHPFLFKIVGRWGLGILGAGVKAEDR